MRVLNTLLIVHCFIRYDFHCLNTSTQGFRSFQHIR
nr:MAG TPA: hypothetical protein [Bacteriophage sp.]